LAEGGHDGFKFGWEAMFGIQQGAVHIGDHKFEVRRIHLKPHP
jgi:hypothetical protein